MIQNHIITVSSGRLQQIKGMLQDHTTAEIAKTLKMPVAVIQKIKEDQQ